MEEEKAAAYYDELTRKGSGAAKFKQGLGFSSTSNDVVPSKGSALPSSTSFFSNFVRASSPSKTDDEIDKQAQLQSIQNKLQSKSKLKLNKIGTQRIENESDRQSSRSSREKDTQSSRRNRSRSLTRNRNRSRSLSRDRDRQRNSKNGSRSRSRDKYWRRKRSRERDSRRRSRSRSRDRDSRRRSRSRERSLSRRSTSRSRERDLRRRSTSRSRERSSRRRSRSRERSSRQRSRSRSRERDSRRISRSRSRERKSRRRSRSRSGGDQGRGGRLSKRNDTSTSVKNERNGLDYTKLIEGYDKMAPAERVKAKMKLQLTETAKKDPTRGTGSGWERFDFDKDATLDDEEEIEAAEDDSGIVKRIGQSFRFSAVEARKEDQIKAAHDEAMFGAPSLPLSSEIDEEKEDSPKCINDNAPDTSLISNQVISMQQVAWRDRVKKM